MTPPNPDKNAQAAARTATRRYAHALATIANAFDALYKAEGHGVARTDSPASADADYLKSEFADLYGEPPGDSISAMLSARFGVAIDHLRGTEQLFLAKKSGVFSVWATARSFFEAVGEAYWLSEPDLDPRARLGRILNTRLVSLRGSQRFIEKGNVAREDVLANPYERENDLLNRSEQMGFQIVNSPAGKQVDPARPSMTELVDGLVTGGLYSLSSAMSHGEVWAMTHHLREVGEIEDPSGGGRLGGYFQVTVEEYRALAMYLHRALGTAVQRLCIYYRWDEATYRSAHDRTALAIKR